MERAVGGAPSTRSEVEHALAAAGAAPDARFPLFEAAISCALHERPDRSPEPARLLLDEATARLKDRLRSELPEDALCEALGGDMRLSGDVITRDDPTNADLISVCDRRKGGAVALGIVYLEAGRRANLKVAGVDFPGHFMLRIETGEGPMALDPFAGGRVVMPSELVQRALATGLPPSAADRLDRLMAPVKDRQILVRLQNVIFARAMRSGDWPLAERSALRRALLDPADHRPWLDVAQAREKQGRLSGALDALARAQTLEGAEAVAARAARDRVRLRLN